MNRDEFFHLMFFLLSGQVSNPSKGVYGAGAHSDYGLITLLATDDVVGLQVIHLETISMLLFVFALYLLGFAL
jgi:isopenicillin N synthase-like dioxygenase